MARRKRTAGNGRRRERGLGPPAGASSGVASRRRPTNAASADSACEALAVTHWFDPGRDGPAYRAQVRFRGRRLDGGAAAADRFTQDEVIEAVLPGSGPVAVTAWVEGLAPGDWEVTAELVSARQAAAHRSSSTGRSSTLPRARWSWPRWALASGPFAPIRTRWAPLHRFSSMPAVIHGSWTALIALGVLVGIGVQTAVLHRLGLGSAPALLVDALALLSGLLVAKLWYIGLRPAEWRQRLGEGWSVDGLLVAAPLVGMASMVVLDVPVGAFLDASAPGLFVGVAIGRLGCFLTGCCAGRCTVSRWGIWSSDRRIGARRIPTQLLESGVGLAIGLGSLWLLALRAPHADGALFIGALAVYVVARQLLLRLRAEPRPYSIAVPATALAATLVLALDAVAAVSGVL